MACPGEKKGQRKGSCGHIMATFDSHDKCARCRDKCIGEDNCVLDKPCPICDGFSDTQRELLATPSYRIRKDKKTGLLVSPKDVTVINSVDTEPTFQSPSGPSAQSPAHPSMASSSAAQQLISETPFLAPATRPTGPVKVPVAVDAQAKITSDDHKRKKKSHKSRKDDPAKDSGSSDIQSDKNMFQKPIGNVTGLGLWYQRNLLWLNKYNLLLLRLIPAPVRSLLISAPLLK